MAKKYRVLYPGDDGYPDEMGARDVSVLVGPDDWWTCMGEPEDATYDRDGSDAVDELNRISATLDAAVAELDEALFTLDATRRCHTECIAERDSARAEVARLRGMMREAEEVLRGHMIGINCKGPRMDDDLAKRWRTALALHIAADSPPHDAAKED